MEQTTNAVIENIFTYHRPTPEQAKKYELLRPKAKELALLIQELCPASEEKTIALRSVQQTIMWANAAVALHEGE